MGGWVGGGLKLDTQLAGLKLGSGVRNLIKPGEKGVSCSPAALQGWTRTHDPLDHGQNGPPKWAARC